MSAVVIAPLLSSGCLPVIDENTADAVGELERITFSMHDIRLTSQFVLEDHSLESTSIHVRGALNGDAYSHMWRKSEP